MEQNSKEVWNQRGSIWATKSAYMAWLRGQLRRAWSRYPIKNAFIRDHRSRKKVGRFKNGKPKVVWVGKCKMCGEEFPTGKLSVDHIKPAGKFTDFSDFEPYVTKLFCSYENLQFLCDPCHLLKTHADKHSISLEDARNGLLGAALRKKPTNKLKGILKGMGASEEDLRNKKTRDSFINKHYKITWL